MREVCVSVHGDALRMLLDDAPNDEERENIETVLEEIDKMWERGRVYEIPGLEYPDLLPSHLPSPYPELKVKVVGTSTWVCCTIQLYSLRLRGYKAELHLPGCYDNGNFSSILQIDRKAKKIIPEFFEALLQDSSSL